MEEPVEEAASAAVPLGEDWRALSGVSLFSLRDEVSISMIMIR
jgi:hypothetical protein